VSHPPVSRRAVTSGLAWSIPAVATVAAAPFAAASACASGPVTVNLVSGTRTVLAYGSTGMPSKIQYVTTDAKTGVTTTVTATAIGSTILGMRDFSVNAPAPYLNTDLTFRNGGFNIQHVTTGTSGEGESVTIAFSRNGSPVPVTNLKMYIDDIDNSFGAWYDGVSFPSTAGLTFTKGADVEGNGAPGTAGATNSGPFHNYYTTQPGDNDAADRLTVTAASTSGFRFDYTNLSNVNNGRVTGKDSDQNIQLTGITFQAPACV